jgi:NAD(P)-dependent dehydrogenase (short-subunit alcohol dehydrogenase family)
LADAALARLREINDPCRFVPLDVSSEESCRTATRTVVEWFGRLDILVNNAGTTVRKLPQDLSELDWQTVIDTNLTTGACLAVELRFRRSSSRHHRCDAAGGRHGTVGHGNGPGQGLCGRWRLDQDVV